MANLGMAPSSKAHPFHLHMYHMLIVSKGGCGMHKEGEFYDTIATPEDCQVRFFTEDFGQQLIMHCHALEHEDNGMMVWMNVFGEGMPMSNENGDSHVCPVAIPWTASPKRAAPVLASFLFIVAAAFSVAIKVG